MEHPDYGDEGWTVTVRSTDRQSATYSTINANAHFGKHKGTGDFNDAEHWVNHPGEIQVFARLHLALVQHGRLEAHRFTLTSFEVKEIITDQIPGQMEIPL